MKKIQSSLILASVMSLSACYSAGGYTPTVDPATDKNAYRINQDMEECRGLASQSSGGGTAKETAVGAGIGGLFGAAAGAIIGAFAGDAGTGAAIGAATGGFGGAAKQGFQSEDRYRNAYNSCMSGRGHNVIR